MKMNWVVSSEDSGSKLIVFLQKKLNLSSKQIKRSLDSGQCQVNGKIERFGSTLLGTEDKVLFYLSSPSTTSKKAFEPSRILYEDDWILAYNKPAGLVSDSKILSELFKTYHHSLYLIHRLDRNTTGVLLFAKQAIALEHMQELFRKHLIHKMYIALVDGIPKKEEGIIESDLGKIYSYQGQTVFGSVEKGKGQHAVTQWKRIAKGKDAALIHCFPKTGRTHQIRVHLSEMGHPILGDSQYGKKFQCSYRPNRTLLHAAEIFFEHPFLHTSIHIQVPLPDDFIRPLV